MSDVDEKESRQKFRWFQVSLRTLLAVILGFGLGLAVGRQFRTGESGLPNPSNVQRGDNVRIQWRLVPGTWGTEQTKVLADGTIRLRELGSVPAAGVSLDELTEELKTRYHAYYAGRDAYGNVPSKRAFMDAAGGPRGVGPSGGAGTPVRTVEIEVFIDFGTASAKE